MLIQIWRLGTTSEAVANLDKVARAFLAEEGVAISSLAIIERTSPPPGDSVRAELSAFYRELAPRMKEQIVVAEGGGFRAAIVRGVGLTLSTLAPRSLPFKFVGTVREATNLIAPHLSPLAGGVEGLERAIEEVRAEFNRSLAAPR